MQAVLYTSQLEPITVVNIPIPLWNRLSRGETVVIAVYEPLSFANMQSDSVPVHRHVSIFAEQLKRREHETLMLFTEDEESAMLLRSEFLPGQRAELLNRERGAFASGFLRALQEFRSE